MRKKQSDFKVNFTSVTGSLAKNNSTFDFVELDNYACWIAADVSEDADKEIAVMITQSILNDFKEKPTINKGDICKYIIKARDLVMERVNSISTRVSLAIAATDYSKLLCIATGTERIYYIESIEQLMLDPDAVLVIGVDEKTANRTLYDGEDNSVFGLFVSKTIKLKDGDVIFFSSSGFWKNVDLKDIINKLYGVTEPYMFLYNLKSVLLAKQEQSLLSYTIAAVFASRVYRNTTSQFVKPLSAVLGILLLLAGFWVFKPWDILLKLKEADLKGSEPEQTAASPGTSVPQKAEYVIYEQNGDGLVQEEKYSQALEEYNKASVWMSSNDPTARKTLQQKIEITQLIIDGDRLVSQEKYGLALEKYKKAKQSADAIPAYDRKGLQKKLLKTQTIQTILELVEKGDKQFNRGNYETALKAYRDAQSKARDIAYNNRKAIDGKVKLVLQKIQEEQARQLAALQSEKKEGVSLQPSVNPALGKAHPVTEQSQQPGKTPGAVKTGWRAYDYTDKVEPPSGFIEGNIKNRMADYCIVNDGALIMDTMAKPSAGPAYKMEIRSTKQVGFAFTVVARAKAGSQFGMDFDFRAVGFRERVRLLSNSVKLEVSSIEKVFKTSDWHTYWITFEIVEENGSPRLLTKVYVDGSASPIIEGISIASDSNNYFRFGDCSSSSGYVGAIDWIAWNFDGAFNPTQIRLPAGLRLK